MNFNIHFRLLIIAIAQLLCVNWGINAQANDTIAKPTITNDMCIKLWYGCQRYDMAKALFYHSMGANGIIENDRLIESMRNGNIEIGEKFIRVIQTLYGREDAWANFKIFGFNQNELEISNKIFDFYKNQQKITKAKQQELQYSEWFENGVPSNLKPDIKAKLYCNNEEAVISYFNENPELFKNGPYKIRVFVGDDKRIRFVDADKPEVSTLFPYLHLQVNEPAYIEFDEIDKTLPISSIVEVNLDFDLYNLPSDYYRGEYEASTKFDKKNNNWIVKVTKDDIDQFNKDVGNHKELYTKCIEKALTRSTKAPKKYIKFKLYNVRVWLTYKGDKYMGADNHSLLSEEWLEPIAIITGDQSAFSRFQTKGGISLF